MSRTITQRRHVTTLMKQHSHGLYCPINQKRATNIGISNTKLRITAVIAVSAEGTFAPLMIIIKHSVSSEAKPDQTTMTVVRDLHKKPGFTVSDGWCNLNGQKEELEGCRRQ